MNEQEGQIVSHCEAQKKGGLQTMNLKKLIPSKQNQLSAWSSRERSPIESFRREMGRVFDEFLGDWPSAGWERAMEGFWPNVDVKDTEKEFKLSVELPGLSEKDVHLLLTKDALTIRGEKREDTEQEQGSYHYAERRYGAFERLIPLPTSVDADKVKATFKEGVLRISLPKTADAQAQRKTIPIQGQ
ncbi:MAG: Hsp20/alpha crystallin family protein [Verrucomicrobia bacterium]|nr:Hsp20/alpha crystallin family protein [Verrucomicrobiota bacterium]